MTDYMQHFSFTKCELFPNVTIREHDLKWVVVTNSHISNYQMFCNVIFDNKLHNISLVLHRCTLDLKVHLSGYLLKKGVIYDVLRPLICGQMYHGFGGTSVRLFVKERRECYDS